MNDHKLVLLSLKRGQYVKNIRQVSASRGWDDDIDYCGDAEPIDEAVEFAACYTEKELRDLAESFGPDFDVQPAPEHFAIMAEDREGPAYGVGLNEAEARQHARESGFGESGSVVKITAQSFNRIMAGDPQAVEIAK